ncbi:aspartate-semialdehyde dehydrogenase [uncultured Pseudomonas sp.]|uniref:aspartate-semialdehyde dehydrogenase n=1 Tax=uncultured Pseudomonas sp. TaxID=114707 RepID=UPI0025FF8977|nr:aspartate-semialdehyde dehydrogenase [uncultured Pseudomonas sp.]
MTARDIALVGATSAYGEAIRELLDERDVPLGRLHLLASGESAGQNLPFRGSNLRVTGLEGFDFAQVGIVILAAPAAVVESLRPQLAAAGCAALDLSGASAALSVLPRINGERLDNLPAAPWLGVPLAAAQAAASVAAVLARLNTLADASLTACLAASGAGRGGVEELARQATELLNGRPVESRLFEGQLAFNLLGRTGAPAADGYTAQEHRLLDECQQVLGGSLPVLDVTALQAPVFFGDSLALSLRGKEPWSLEQVLEALGDEPGLALDEEVDCPSAVGDALGREEVLVGRVRLHPRDARRLECWLVADNVRLSALTAVQLAELLLKQSA